MVNVTQTTTLLWRSAQAKLKKGVLNVLRVAWVCDSKGAGAGAGTGTQRMDGAFPKSVVSQFADMLVADGFTIRESWFGAAGLANPAAIVAYDPRRSGFTGWGGGAVSLGGACLAAGSSAGIGYFQSSRAIDRTSVFVRISTGGGQLKVAKGSESFTINTVGAEGFLRSEIVFTTKSTDPVQYSWQSGGFVSVIGGVTWDSAQPGVEVANFSIYGTTSIIQSGTATPSAPLSALGSYQPHLTFIKLWTNDLNTGVALAAADAALRAIVSKGKLTGSVVLIWPSIGGAAPAYGSDAVRAMWRAKALKIALDLGAVFFDEEAMLGGRAGANASGALPDNVHAAEWAQLLEAVAHFRLARW